LIFIILILFCLLLFFYKNSKAFKPCRIKGKYKSIKWIADIKEYDKKKGWDIWFYFVCPIHKTYLGRKDANVPDCAYGVLWCQHCNKEYPFHEKKSIIHLEEVKSILRNKVASKLKIPFDPSQHS